MFQKSIKYILTLLVVGLVIFTNLFNEKISISCCLNSGCFSVSPGSYVTVYAPLKPGITSCSPTCDHVWTISSGSANVFHIKGWVSMGNPYTTASLTGAFVNGTKFDSYWIEHWYGWTCDPSTSGGWANAVCNGITTGTCTTSP